MRVRILIFQVLLFRLTVLELSCSRFSEFINKLIKYSRPVFPSGKNPVPEHLESRRNHHHSTFDLRLPWTVNFLFISSIVNSIELTFLGVEAGGRGLKGTTATTLYLSFGSGVWRLICRRKFFQVFEDWRFPSRLGETSLCFCVHVWNHEALMVLAGLRGVPSPTPLKARVFNRRVNADYILDRGPRRESCAGPEKKVGGGGKFLHANYDIKELWL